MMTHNNETPLQQVLNARGLRFFGVDWSTRGNRITGVWSPMTGEEYEFAETVEYGSQNWVTKLNTQLEKHGYRAVTVPQIPRQAAISLMPAHMDHKKMYDKLTQIADEGYSVALDNELLDDYGMLKPEIRAMDPWERG